jgi:hypothetical protein
MVNIKRFIDKVSSLEGRNVKDLVMPTHEARILRDEIVKLMADNYELLSNKKKEDPVFEVQVNGGKW